MRTTLICMAALTAALMAGHASAAEYGFRTRPDLVYAEHDGAKLIGDLYLPKGRAKAPALVAIHGGGWQAGNRAYYKYWGPFLARNGYALFTIEYRLGRAGVYPAAVYDAKAAIQFVRAKAAEFDIDPDRIGLMGDSAGGYLAAMVALAGDQFNSAYRNDPNAGTPINVKAVVGFYGIYDMLAQWKHDVLAQQKHEMLAQRNHDLISRPNDNITEKFFGVSPMQARRIYVEFIADQLRHHRSQSGALPAHPRRPRRSRRSAYSDGGLLCDTYTGRVFRATDYHSRRWSLLGVRLVRKPAPQLRCHGGAAAVAISGRLALNRKI